MTELHIGLDDTDSKKGMCTTFVVNRIINELGLEKCLVGYPELIRLNPTIPWKTRGNGALCLRVNVEEEKIDELKEKVIGVVEEYREKSSNTGVVFFKEDPRKIREISNFAKKGVKKIVRVQRARELVEKHGDVKEFNNGQGIVGALCACGYIFSSNTYELISYRKRDKWGKNRDINVETVKEASKRHYPVIWDNYDWENDEAVLSPNTPCPVLFGMRGDNVKQIKEAVERIICEEVFSSTLFKSNQGTDEHLIKKDKIVDVNPYTSVIVSGKIIKEPYTIEGGHVLFTVSDNSGKIDCAAYEPTKGFRDVVRSLVCGDNVKVFGGVRKEPLTINLEKIEILDLSKDVINKNPVCPSCGNRMKSAGKNQGLRCRECKIFAKEKVTFFNERKLEEKVYEVPVTARRHLSKPLVREDKE